MEKTENQRHTWQGFQHGVNLGGWLSQCNHTRERYDTFIREEDIGRIASWGLDHIRVPVDYELVEDEQGGYREEGFAILARVIGWCRAAGLNMVLDLHKTYGFSFDCHEGESGLFGNPACQERFWRLWEQFATRFGGDRDMLAFELLNEVTDQAYAASWTRIADTCISRIRAIAPDIDILVGSYWNNSIDALPDLEAPKDAHVIYNFHCYDPIVFTHQGAPWVQGMDRGFRFSLDRPMADLAAETEAFLGEKPEDFEGLNLDEPLSQAYFDRRFAKAVAVAAERGVRLYCGEYGVIDRARPEDALTWYRAISSAFDAAGIGRAAWSYRQMDFGLVDDAMKGVFEQVVKLL